MKISRELVTRVALWKQGLYGAPSGATKEAMMQVIRQLGCVQLDALNVVTRSHNLVFRSRMAHYEEAWLTALYAERQVFEGYVHALSLLPMEERAYVEPLFQTFRQKLLTMEQEQVDQVFDLYNEIKRRAPVTSRQLTEASGSGEPTHRDEEPWSLSPVRWGVEQLWRSGLLTAVRDASFRKVIHLTEQWVPADYLDAHTTLEAYELRYAERALAAMGVATEA